MWLRFCISIFLFPVISWSQVTITYNPIFKQELTSDSLRNNQFQLTHLSFYIGHVELLNDNKSVAQLSDYYLIDLTDSTKNKLNFPLASDLVFNRMRFQIGIDSSVIENGVMSGDLDPMNGHFWSWQSGYIHFKLEGEFLDKPITYHIGGVSGPTNTLQTVILPVISINQHVTIAVTLDPIIAWLKKTNDCEIMSPSLVAVEFSTLFHQLFQATNR